MPWFLLFLLILIVAGIYFIPSFISKGKVRFGQVFIINLFLWWTLIGWVIALVMAIDRSNVSKEREYGQDQWENYTTVIIRWKEVQILNEDLKKIHKLKKLLNWGLISEKEHKNKLNELCAKYIEEEEFSLEDQLQALNISFEKWELTKKEYELKKKKLLDEMFAG